MLSKKLKEIADTKAKLAALEQQAAQDREKALAALPGELGYSSVEELISALQGLGKAPAPKRRGRKKKVGRPAAAPKAAKKTAAKSASKKRTRTKITPALRTAIIDSVKAGKTGAAVAKEHGVSLPTVQNIKRDAGLTKKRGK